ncbi:MAG: hypothetical protein JSV00_06695 [bacterium]|nr:MAG: hypothetical protein JSV00_06695 [bacterium]
MAKRVSFVYILGIAVVWTLGAGCGGGSPKSWVHPADLSDAISPPGGAVSLAVVAMNSNAEAIVAWAQADSTHSRIFIRERDPETGLWTGPADLASYINPDGTGASSPSVAMDDSGNAIVAWSQPDLAGSTWIFVSQRDGATGSWTHPADLSDHLAPSNAFTWPDTAMGAGGNALIAWSMSNFAESSRVNLVERAGAGGPWSAPMDLYVSVPSSGPVSVYAPEVAMDDSGDAIVTWVQSEPLGSTWIFVSERNGATGPWSHPSGAGDSIAVADSSVSNPRLAMASDGDAVISWTESDGANLQVFAAWRDGGTGAWTYPAGLSDNLSPDGTEARFNRSGVNSRGDAVVIWRQYDGDGFDQIFMSERSGMTGLWDNPADLADNISPDGAHAFEREVDMDDRGHTVVAWKQNDGTGFTQIFLSERGSTGDSWSHPADLADNISPDGVNVSPPQVAVGGRGNAVVLWRQGTGTDRLYMSEKR